MPFTLNMPKLSPTMEEGAIVRWHKKEGDSVQVGDVLFEVATDKATVEHQALDEGWLRQILAKEGEEVVINQPVAIMTLEQNETIAGFNPLEIFLKEKEAARQVVASAPVPSESKALEEGEGKRVGGGLQQPQFSPEPPLTDYVFDYPSAMPKGIQASPLAKKLAKERGLDLTSVKGSGPHQRILSRDLEKAQPLVMGKFRRWEAPQDVPGSYSSISLSPMRKTIAQRLQDSKTFIPHFYVKQVIDAEPLIELRDQLNGHQIKFSVNDFIVRACAMALREHPSINRGFDTVNQKLIQFHTIDIAIAVSLEAGLITPIVRHADYKNLSEISTEVRLLAQKARKGQLKPEEYKGGSFTISNLGMYGISDFQAIINPPQAAIVAVSAIQDVPVVKNHCVVPGKTLTLTLSVDHRVIDGIDAALFLQTLKKLLEKPSILIIL